MVLRPVLGAVLAIALVQPAQTTETVLRCVTETNAEVSRRICAPFPVSGDIKVDLPDAAPPPVTEGGRGLTFHLALPDPPPAAVVIPERDLRALAPPLPPFPVVAIHPPEPPVPPKPVVAAALPPFPLIAILPPEPPPAPVAAAMPQETLQAALRRLRSGNRITEAEADGAFAFYKAREFQPLWIAGQRWGARAEAVRRTLAAAADDGMDSSRYRSVAQFIEVGEPQWHALAAAEVQLTESVILYAREAAIGRVRPGQVHPLITPSLDHDAADAVLKRVSGAGDAAEALLSFQPGHQQYRRLRAALAAARQNRPAVAAGEPIPDGPPLRIGMRDPRVPLIRARLGMGYDSTSVYDREVSVRVASLQRSSGLPVNGAFTAQTRRALVGEAPSPEESEIIANMEFWRWMPRELGREHIFVNTPAYKVEVRRGDDVVFDARTIVGKPDTQTPFFSDTMDHIVVNPSWYIPPGILKREPKYLSPEYATARGYEIRTRGNVTTVRVPPGSSNALGYVKFIFPNHHSVYLHDTPNRSLFNARVRTLSNGCVRVENPMRLAALLFETEGLTEERFRRMQGGGERRMNLPRKLPVHLGYFTMTVGPDGAIERHPDVYGHALRLRQLLGMS